MTLIHGRTVVYNVNYHLVWSVKYRRPVLTEPVQDRLKTILREIALSKGFTVDTVEVMPDHVHVFVSAPPKLPPSYLYKMMKGISGRKLLVEFEDLKKHLWRGHLWNPSTYIETIGHISEETVKRYIEDQKKQ
ncbi:MAG: IS200/IS605 family transposase [Syntrophorhabdales bacterium]|jgi:putative transposase